MIDATGLTKTFGQMTAVDGVTFHVDDGEVFGFLGPNGAGKTTVMRMLSCLISKSAGEARIGGYEIGNEADSFKIRKMVGLIPDDVGLYSELSAYENLDFYGKLYECPQDQRRQNIEHFLSLFGLWEKRTVAVGTFSKGMKQKVAIARALVHDPSVLLLDEPTANLDPESSRTVKDFIVDLKKSRKKTVVLNTHNLDEARELCDRIGILSTRLLAVGTPDQLGESISKTKTVVRLVEINDAIVAAARGAVSANVSVDGNTLIVDVANLSENAVLVQALVAAGGRVLLVTQPTASLEDVYLNVVRGSR